MTPEFMLGVHLCIECSAAKAAGIDRQRFQLQSFFENDSVYINMFGSFYFGPIQMAPWEHNEFCHCQFQLDRTARI